ncbi:MAG: hypothetical protein WKF43_08035 [Acidimicrobiales bacterium]
MSSPPAAIPSDLAYGAFSADPPWLVNLDALTWRQVVPAQRARIERELPELIRPRRLPPGLRVVRVAGHIGGALAGWALSERRRGGSTPGPASHAG